VGEAGVEAEAEEMAVVRGTRSRMLQGEAEVFLAYGGFGPQLWEPSWSFWSYR